jgi:hypothetical protein
MLRSILILLCLSFPVYANFGDEGQYQDSSVKVENVVDVSQEVINDITKEPEVKNLSNDLNQEFKENAELLKEIQKELLELAKEMRKVIPVKMTNPEDFIGDNLRLDERVSILEGKINKLEDGELTPKLDSKVREIAVEEYKKLQVKVTNKETGVSTEKTVILKKSELKDANNVVLPGYAGTFQVLPGEVITSIDGQPVQSMSNNIGYTNDTFIKSTPVNNGFSLRLLQPLRGNVPQFLPRCRMVNGVKVCN